MIRSLSFATLALSLLLPGCVTTPADAEASTSTSTSEPQLFEPSLPWTTAFLDTSILVAEHVHVEGPSGLLRHFAARVEEEFHERSEETVPEGYRQVIRVRTDGPLVEVRSYLDRMELVATRTLTVLERPGDVDVVVEARGDVYYSCAEQQRSERAQALRFVGRRPGK